MNFLEEIKRVSKLFKQENKPMVALVITHGIFIDDRILFITKGRMTKTCNGLKFEFHKSFWLNSTGNTEVNHLYNEYFVHEEKVVMFEGGRKSTKLPSYKELMKLDLFILNY